MRTSRVVRRRPPSALGRLFIWFAPACFLLATRCHAQGTPPPAPQNAPSPTQNAPPSVTLGQPLPNQPPGKPLLHISAEGEFRQDSASGYLFASDNVRIEYSGTTLTADRAEGNINSEIVLSGNAKIVSAGLTSRADAIHFFPKQRTVRLENPRAVLEPSLLQNRLLDPLRLRGGSLLSRRDGYQYAQHFHTTPCTSDCPHYELRVRSAELIPERRLVLKRVGVYLFGTRLIVIPEIIIPLDRRQTRFRTDYLPEFGRNFQEGYFARFPYAFAIGSAAAAFLRLDVTERQGLGYRVEQEYLAGKQESYFDTSDYSGDANFNFSNPYGTYVNAIGYGTSGSRLPRLGTGAGPNNGGLFAIQGYFADGFSKNLNASFRHQQGIGSNNRIAFSTEVQNNSSFGFSSQKSQTTRLGFTHNDPAHGVNTDLGINYSTNDSSGFATSQISATYRQSFEFGVQGSNRNSLSFNFDLSRFVSRSEAFRSRTARLNSEFQFQHASRDYSFSLQGNKNSPIGPQTDNSAFGTLERLPELQFATDTMNFQRGWLKRLPLRLEVGFGQYSEPGSNTNTSRTLFALSMQEQSIARGNTEISTGGGFEQRLYGDGAAQYIIRNTSRLRQRLGGRSGFDLNYQYQEPAGGTSFQFDTFGRSHYIAAEAGYLNDSRFQLTARVGYDFLGTSAERPWQSLSTRLMWRPNNHTRFDLLSTYDPNTARFFAVTGSLRLRGRNDFAFDLLSRYDPQTGRFSQVNGQFEIPLGGGWRFAGLARYNGFRGRFESINWQLLHRWDCMEATLTYSETPFGIQNNTQFYFALRLTAFPFFRSFARGPGGDAIGPGLGDLY